MNDETVIIIVGLFVSTLVWHTDGFGALAGWLIIFGIGAAFTKLIDL